MIASFALVAAVAALTTGATAIAQIDPDDLGLGTKLGMAQRNNSGQVGTVSLFARGAYRTVVVLHVFSTPADGIEAAHIERGRTCAAREKKPAYALASVTGGISRTVVPAAASRLLSGNYVVAVRTGGRRSRFVSCGELYH